MANNYDLVMWGPTASGKTSFLGAFSNAMSHLSVNNADFDYRLAWYDPKKNSPYITDSSLWGQEVSQNWSKEYEEATSTLTQGHKRYIFQCLSKRNYAELANYQIGVFDAGGSDLLKAVSADVQDGDPIIRAYLDSSNSFIATFDLEEIIRNDSSRRDSLDALRNLLQYLASKRTTNNMDVVHNINLAICMNKIDLIDLRWEKPETIYHVAFEEPLKDLERYYQKKLNVKVFATSVMGFFENNFSEYSNFDRQEHRPRFVDKWVPWNVHAPFFWIFEQWKNANDSESFNWLNSFWKTNLKHPYYIQPFF